MVNNENSSNPIIKKITEVIDWEDKSEHYN